MSKSNTLLHITNGIWLIEPSAVSAFTPFLKQIFDRDPELLSREAKSPRIMIIGTDGAVDLAPESGMGSTAGYAGSVAVVRISGAIMKYDNCGDAGTASLAEAVKELNANANISAIVFKVDSPGGEVSGTEEFAKIIKSCTKPTIGYIDGMCASACYWLMSQCDEIYCGNKTDMVGSIGTMCSFADMQPMYEAQGVVFHDIYADASKDKNQDFIEARKGNYDLVKQRLNQINEIFISSVTEARGSKLNQTETLTGKVFMAEDAVKMGLVDGLKSFDEVVGRAQELSGKSNQSNHTNQNQNPMKIKAIWGAMAAFLASAFTGFTAEETIITEEHLEKMNAELETLGAVKVELQTVKESVEAKAVELLNANALLAEKTTALETLTAELTELKEKNPGAVSTVKTGADDTGATELGYTPTSVDKEKAELIAKGF